MSVIGYRRVSSEGQRLDRQDLGSVDELYDEKLSGKDRQRPVLTEALAYCRKGDTFRVHSADRLARSLKDLIGIVDDLTSRGVRVEFVKEGMTFDPAASDPYTRCLMQVMGAFAELERNIIRARQEDGIALAKERRAYKGRQPALSPAEVLSAKERQGFGVPVARLARDHGVAKSTMVAALAGEGVYGQADYR